jgi:hypothetical protein
MTRQETKPKTVKVVYLSGQFMELPAAHSYVEGRGEGTNVKIAAQRAIKDLFGKKELRARRITAAKLTLSVGTKTLDTQQETQ